MPSGEILRAAIIAVANAVIPAAVLFGLDWTADQVAAVMVCISTVLTLVFLFYKGGTTATPPIGGK